MKTSLLRLVAPILAAGICFWAISATLAQTPSTPQRLPGNANALMTVDVARIIQSPLGQKQGWQSALIKGYADRPLPVPATAKRVTLAAALHPAGMRAVWQAAIIELTGTPRLEPILKAQGGYMDQIGGKSAAWTPRDVFYVQLNDNTLGVVRPGQRQYATRWVAGTDQAALSKYLKLAQESAANADVLFAVDLDDVVSTTAIRYAAGMGQLPSLEKLEGDEDKVIAALATVQGMKIVAHITDRIAAEMTVDFEKDVSALSDYAKPFIADVLACADLQAPMFDQWQLKVEGNRIVGKGTMEMDGLREMLMLLSPGQVAEAAAATPESAASDSSAPGATAAAPAADPKTDAVQASQRYYKAVSAVLDAISGKTSPTQSGTWLISKGREIEQLPVLNVDPALLAWGSSVVEAFNRAAVELGVGQQRAQVAAQNVASPTAYTNYNVGGMGGNETAETRAAYRNAQQERRKVAQAERGAAAERALGILQEMLSARGKIRAEMVQKYGVEF